MMFWVVVVALFAAAKYGLLVGVLIVAVGYAGSCWWFPLARCMCCHGRGRHWRDDGKVFRRCSWCSGSGARRRVGRVVLDAMQK